MSAGQIPCQKARPTCTHDTHFLASAGSVGTILPNSPSHVYTRDAISDGSPSASSDCRVSFDSQRRGRERRLRSRLPHDASPKRSATAPSERLSVPRPSTCPLLYIKVKTMAVTSRRERFPAGGVPARAGPTWHSPRRGTRARRKPPRPVAAASRCEHSHREAAAIRRRLGGLMAGDSRYEHSLREFAAKVQGLIGFRLRLRPGVGPPCQREPDMCARFGSSLPIGPSERITDLVRRGRPGGTADASSIPRLRFPAMGGTARGPGGAGFRQDHGEPRPMCARKRLAAGGRCRVPHPYLLPLRRF